MTEPSPTYTAVSEPALQVTPASGTMQQEAVVSRQQLDDLERRLTAALYEIWQAQGKHKKVVTLR